MTIPVQVADFILVPGTGTNSDTRLEGDEHSAPKFSCSVVDSPSHVPRSTVAWLPLYLAVRCHGMPWHGFSDNLPRRLVALVEKSARKTGSGERFLP
jgi:hypothetical protein